MTLLTLLEIIHLSLIESVRPKQLLSKSLQKLTNCSLMLVLKVSSLQLPWVPKFFSVKLQTVSRANSRKLWPRTRLMLLKLNWPKILLTTTISEWINSTTLLKLMKWKVFQEFKISEINTQKISRELTQESVNWLTRERPSWTDPQLMQLKVS
jgi:hypothetical protein